MQYEMRVKLCENVRTRIDVTVNRKQVHNMQIFCKEWKFSLRVEIEPVQFVLMTRNRCTRSCQKGDTIMRLVALHLHV